MKAASLVKFSRSTKSWTPTRSRAVRALSMVTRTPSLPRACRECNTGEGQNHPLLLHLSLWDSKGNQGPMHTGRRKHPRDRPCWVQWAWVTVSWHVEH